jgi:hypothetical protein
MGCSIKKCTIKCNNPQSGLHLVNIQHLGAARSGTIIIPHNNFQSSVSLSALRLTSSIWIRNQPACFKMIQAHPRHQWNLETMTMNRYRSQGVDNKQVGAALFKHESSLKIVVCFAVSASAGFVKVSGERQSLRQMCENISVSPSLRYSIQSCAVHHIRLMDDARLLRVQARLKQHEVMGENVWIIDLALLS